MHKRVELAQFFSVGDMLRNLIQQKVRQGKAKGLAMLNLRIY